MKPAPTPRTALNLARRFLLRAEEMDADTELDEKINALLGVLIYASDATESWIPGRVREADRLLRRSSDLLMEIQTRCVGTDYGALSLIDVRRARRLLGVIQSAETCER